MPTLKNEKSAEIQPIPREIEMLERAAAFLAECQDLDQVKDLRDRAEALRLYQKKIGDSQRAQASAAAIKVRAERRMGELLREMPKQGPGEYKRSQLATVSPTIADLNITKSDSSRCQAMAALPSEEFEETVTKAVEAGRGPTSRELYTRGQSHQRAERKRAELKAKAVESIVATRERTWEIRQGDCLDILGTIEDESTRLIFADPPYNIGVDYGDHYDDSRPSYEFDEWCQLWLAECFRKLTDDGSLWLLVNHEWARTLCFRAEDLGYHLRQWITWYESFGVNTTGMFNRCSRPLLWLVKDAGNFLFDVHAPQIRRPSDRQAIYNDPRANPDGKIWDDVWGINPPIPRVVGTAKERMPDFPTQLPLALLRPIVACASAPGDLVIDPFSGSGTTGAACIELGRRFIGLELSEDFADLSRARLAGMEAEHVVS